MKKIKRTSRTDELIAAIKAGRYRIFQTQLYRFSERREQWVRATEFRKDVVRRADFFMTYERLPSRTS
jgi:hypothetical protein